MIRKIKRIIHVTEMKDGESAIIHKWNGGDECAGIIVTRAGDRLKSERRLPRCPIDEESRFFNSTTTSKMEYLGDSGRSLFRVIRTS